MTTIGDEVHELPLADRVADDTGSEDSPWRWADIDPDPLRPWNDTVDDSGPEEGE